MPAENREYCERCRAEVASQALFCPMCGLPRATREGDNLIGKVIADRYLLRERIGQGGSGTIYVAEHITVKRKIAVKVYHHELSRDDLAVERFRREATTVAEIDNEHIVEVLDFGRLEDGRLFLAMELLEGETLAAALKREQQLPIEQCLDILIQVGEALMEAHAMGYIHRDLRPGNIFLSRRRGRQGFVKILDFGLSKLLQREGEAATTSIGMTFGDPCYMSPEQARGDPADRRADVYALGVMAYEMLIGRPPFVGKKVFEVLTQHIESPAEPPSKARPEVPPWLDALVMRALAKKPEDRFITVYRLIEAIRDGQSTGKIMDEESALSMPAIEPPPPAPRRRDTDEVPPLPAPATASTAPSASRRVAMAALSNKPAGSSIGWFDEEEKPSTATPAAGSSSIDLEPPRSRRGLFIALGILGGGAAVFAVLAFLATRGRESAASPLPDAAVAAAPAPAPRPEVVEIQPTEPPPAAPAHAPQAPAHVATTPPPPVTTPPPEPVRPATPPAHAATPPPAKPGPAHADTPRVALPTKPRPAPAPSKPEPAPSKPTAGDGRKAPPVFDFRPKPAPAEEEESEDEEETDEGVVEDAPAKPTAPAATPPSPPAGSTGTGDFADFYVKLGLKALRDGDPAAATESFNKARTFDTRNADAIAGLGQVALKTGKFQEATVHLEAASRLAPRSARIHALRGQAYLGAGDRDSAAAAFKKALAIDPDNKAAADGLRQLSSE